MRIVWLPEALDDVERLFDFLVGKDPLAAKRAMRTISRGSDKLQEAPELGRPLMDDTGRREVVIPFGAGAYVLRYRIHDDTVAIIRVWHSREDR